MSPNQKGDDPLDHLPLTALAFDILLALGDGPRHGYAIIQDIEARNDGTKLRSGTLYTAIQRLQADGLIQETPKRPHVDRDDDRRRYYEVTRLGCRVAELESARLAAMLNTARARKLYHPHEVAK